LRKNEAFQGAAHGHTETQVVLFAVPPHGPPKTGFGAQTEAHGGFFMVLLRGSFWMDSRHVQFWFVRLTKLMAGASNGFPKSEQWTI
jgi:hypothetical protein